MRAAGNKTLPRRWVFVYHGGAPGDMRAHGAISPPTMDGAR